MTEFLKCDADGCGHREMVDALSAEMVGKPCPNCGANLLTQSDWEMWRDVFQPAFQAMKEAGLIQPIDATTPASKLVGFNYHDGELRVRGLRKDGQ